MIENINEKEEKGQRRSKSAFEKNPKASIIIL